MLLVKITNPLHSLHFTIESVQVSLAKAGVWAGENTLEPSGKERNGWRKTKWKIALTLQWRTTVSVFIHTNFMRWHQEIIKSKNFSEEYEFGEMMILKQLPSRNMISFPEGKTSTGWVVRGVVLLVRSQ